MLLLKQKPATFVNGLLGFITLGICLRWKRVCIARNNYMSCPSIWATLSALLINILLGFLPVVLHSDQPLLRSEIIPFSGVCQSGGGCIIHAGGNGGFTHWRQTALMCNRRRPAATSSRRASFSALASANSFVCFIERSNITLTHLHVSNCRVRQLQFSGIFCRWAVGNGVITVLINSPWQADDDADNQSGDNRDDSAHTSISLTVPPYEFCNQAVSHMLELTITSARQWSPDIAATVDCWRIITTINRRAAPRSLICTTQCHSVLTFRREVFQAKLLAVGIHQRERSW